MANSYEQALASLEHQDSPPPKPLEVGAAIVINQHAAAILLLQLRSLERKQEKLAIGLAMIRTGAVSVTPKKREQIEQEYAEVSGQLEVIKEALSNVTMRMRANTHMLMMLAFADLPFAGDGKKLN